MVGIQENAVKEGEDDRYGLSTSVSLSCLNQFIFFTLLLTFPVIIMKNGMKQVIPKD